MTKSIVFNELTTKESSLQTPARFSDLPIDERLLAVLAVLGYEAPTPIQEKSIPVLLEGKDLLAQAQTGTGKTAAFALPILTQLSLDLKSPQAIVIAPTRELALQVAEAFKELAKGMPDFHVLAIYGGQDYLKQFKALQRGVHVIVGTPGRVMDLLRSGKIRTDSLKTIVLDEADKMLEMGFKEDVEWILEQLPEERQMAMFSATLPAAIINVSKKYLKDPVKIKVESKTSTVSTIDQFGIMVAPHHKLEALTRFLEIEDFDGAIIFTRTKIASDELAEKLESRGHSAASINGDLKQSQRERVIRDLKAGTLDIIVATEVAARGLDVSRLSHVINYDMPHDVDSYVHRIGRTGRAGREGKSILFVTPKEQRMLDDIMYQTKQPIKMIELPSVKQVHAKRSNALKEELMKHLDSPRISEQREWVSLISHETEHSIEDIAAALALMLQKDQPKLEDIAPARAEKARSRKPERSGSFSSDRKPRGRSDFGDKKSYGRSDAGERKSFGDRSAPRSGAGAGNFKSTSRYSAPAARVGNFGDKPRGAPAGRYADTKRTPREDGNRYAAKPRFSDSSRSAKPRAQSAGLRPHDPFKGKPKFPKKRSVE